MHGVILAGGLGTRLYPVTREIPKALIPIQGKPLTDHVFDVLYRAGADEALLSLSYRLDSVLERYTPCYKGHFGHSYEMPTRWVKDEQNGTAAWIPLFQQAKISLSEDFFVLNGDNLCAVDLRKALFFHRENKAGITVVLRKMEDVSSFGVAELEGNRICRFVEKPAPGQEPSSYINTGYYVFSKKILASLSELFPKDLSKQSWKVMLEHDVFPKVAASGGLFAYPCEDLWFDTGTFERWNQVIDEWVLPRGTHSRA
jgi:NDP-sugar pyrophosphorylase family protein